MNILMKLVSLLACLFLLICCAKAPVPPPQYSYDEDAIRITVKADGLLNLYQGSPHTLLACVYQLNSRNAFNQLAGDTDGLYKLLECSPFDASVTNVERLIIQPGQKTTINLDRAEGTRYVAVVAGYNTIDKDGDVRIFDIPVAETTSGLIRKTTTLSPEKLEVDLNLGPEKINN